MNRARLFSIFVAMAMPAVPSSSAVHETTAPAADAVAQQAAFDQKLGAGVPLDAVFRDETGQPVTLGYLLGESKRPAVLVLGYKDCPMLCSLVLTGMVESFTDLRLTAGRDFEVIDVSIDPRQSPEDAGAQKRVYCKRYARPDSETGWHFLTSPDDATIRRLADAIGFHYAYDPVTKQYAHPSGLVILTPAGRVSQYLYGVTFDPATLQDALTLAGAQQIGSPIEQLLLRCFHFNPVSGKYGASIIYALRIGGVLTLLALGGGIGYLIRRDPRHRPAIASVP